MCQEAKKWNSNTLSSQPVNYGILDNKQSPFKGIREETEFFRELGFDLNKRLKVQISQKFLYHGSELSGSDAMGSYQEIIGR